MRVLLQVVYRNTLLSTPFLYHSRVLYDYGGIIVIDHVVEPDC